MTRKGQTYKPKRTAEYERNVSHHAREAARNAIKSDCPDSDQFFPKGTPVEVQSVFVFSRGSSKAVAPMANSYGDVDNIAKSILDGCTQAGNVWHDDNQVIKMVAEKRFGPEAAAHVFIREVKDEEMAKASRC